MLRNQRLNPKKNMVCGTIPELTITSLYDRVGSRVNSSTFTMGNPMLESTLKGLSHEIDFKNVDENGQILALLRAAAGF